MSGEFHAPALYPEVPIKNDWLRFIFYTFWVKKYPLSLSGTEQRLLGLSARSE